jgi:hypothetical protein
MNKRLPERTHTKGWTPERRARQAARAREQKLWRNSTGPKTAAGKARSAQNALKHGQRSRARILKLRKVRYVLRVAAQNVAAMNAIIARAKAKRTLIPPYLLNAWAGKPARSRLPALLNEGSARCRWIRAGAERAVAAAVAVRGP